MGNSSSRSRKAAKVMKIDGELFKFPTPAKVSDVIKDYPNHILLDSEEFLLFNLRANPLDSEHDLKPKRVYLLVELPKFPNSPLRRVQSGVSESTVVKIMTPARSVSDLSSIMTRSTVEIDRISDGGRSSVGSSPGGGGPATRRVKMRLRKAVVDRIMAESRDEVEVVDKILKLSVEEEEEREKESSAAEDGGGVAEIVVADGGNRGEGEERDAHCFNNVKCSPGSSSYCHRKYKRLTS